MASFAEISDDALTRITEIATLADTWSTQTLARMDTLAASADAALAQLESLTYSPDPVSGLTYSGPGDPVEPDYTGESVGSPADPDFSSEAVTDPVEPDYSAEGPADPVINTLATVAAFSFSEGSYTDAVNRADLVKDEIQTAIVNTLGGTLVIGNTIWDAVWALAVERNSIQQVGEEWQASDVGASKGWELPSEVTLARLDKAEEDTSKRVSAVTLEKVIQQAQQYREDFWNAVGQGTTFEQGWLGHYNTYYNRSLEAAQATVQQAIAINQQLLAQDDVNVRVYLAKWDGLARRISATAQMLGARASATQAEISKFGTRHQSESQLLSARTGALGLEVEDRRGRHTEEAQVLTARTGVKRLELDGETVRLNYNKQDSDVAFREEDGEAEMAKEKTRQSITNIIGVVSSLATLASGMAQAALAASDVSVGTAANINENWSVQGPI